VIGLKSVLEVAEDFLLASRFVMYLPDYGKV
jgi:hypothetical protein